MIHKISKNRDSFHSQYFRIFECIQIPENVQTDERDGRSKYDDLRLQFNDWQLDTFRSDDRIYTQVNCSIAFITSGMKWILNELCEQKNSFFSIC